MLGRCTQYNIDSPTSHIIMLLSLSGTCSASEARSGVGVFGNFHHDVLLHYGKHGDFQCLAIIKALT